MDFERKVELTELLAEQDHDVAQLVVDHDLPAALGEEPVVEPAPPEEAVKPDETALAAWVDDLREFERDHAGESAAVAVADKLTRARLDDLAARDRERMFGDRTAADEQEGVVADFHADLMLEGAALDVRAPDDPYLVPAAPREPSSLESDPPPDVPPEDPKR